MNTLSNFKVIDSKCSVETAEDPDGCSVDVVTLVKATLDINEEHHTVLFSGNEKEISDGANAITFEDEYLDLVDYAEVKSQILATPAFVAEIESELAEAAYQAEDEAYEASVGTMRYHGVRWSDFI